MSERSGQMFPSLLRCYRSLASTKLRPAFGAASESKKYDRCCCCRRRRRSLALHSQDPFAGKLNLLLAFDESSIAAVVQNRLRKRCQQRRMNRCKCSTSCAARSSCLPHNRDDDVASAAASACLPACSCMHACLHPSPPPSGVPLHHLLSRPIPT